MNDLKERLAQMTPLQRAAYALKETRARLEALEQKRKEPIAIVGLACRFPGGATSPDAYWKLLYEGRDALRETPPDRWDADAFFDPDPTVPGKTNCRVGGFLDGIYDFDNRFFELSDREAMRMDPQQRLLLELAWEALEDGGFPPPSLRGSRTGVFVGIGASDHAVMLGGDPSQTDAFIGTGNSLCMAANRLSYFLDLKGPSVAVDTACTSALVAADWACRRLRDGEIDMALVGGVNVVLSPLTNVNLTKAGLVAPDGRIRAFDAAACGYTRSDGAGVVVLKPLSAALRDRDRVYAVIRSSAVTQNGRSNGLTAPSRQAQEEAIRSALAQADVRPDQVQYVEAHGTGTALGDAVEAKAIGGVMREGRSPDRPCLIGSAKTNLGHVEAASGMAALIKVALSLTHGETPASLNFENPNPNVPFDELLLSVPQQRQPWPDTAGGRRLAGVNAYGWGGSVAHLLVEEPPAPQPPPAGSDPSRAQILPLSARTQAALKELARRYRDFLEATDAVWPDICYSAAAGREHHPWRLAVSAASREEAHGKLAAFLAGENPVGVAEGHRAPGGAPTIAFAFAGDPAVWAALKPDHLARVPGMSVALDEIGGVLKELTGVNLDELAPDFPAKNDSTSAAALVALQLALSAWWRSLGVSPHAVLGHGVGELAAAAAAGILSVEDAVRLAAAWGDRRPETAQAPALRRPSRPCVSAVDGRIHSGPGVNIAEWLDRLNRPAAVETAVGALLDRQVDVFLEMGPNSITPAVTAAAASTKDQVLTLPALVAQPAHDHPAQATVASLYAAGAELNWKTLFPEETNRVSIPTYPWQRRLLKVECGTWRAAAAPAPQTSGETRKSRTVAIRPRPEIATPYCAAQTPLEEDIAKALCEVLRLERVGVDDSFFELGGDSLQATVLLNRLQSHLGVAISGSVLFEIQTVRDWAEYLRRTHAEIVRRLYSSEAATGNGAARHHPQPDPSVSLLPVAQDDADALLARLDDLPADEVDSLLSQYLSPAESTNE